MSNDLLLDTNLLVYAIDHSSKFHDATLQFIDEATENLFTKYYHIPSNNFAKSNPIAVQKEG